MRSPLVGSWAGCIGRCRPVADEIREGIPSSADARGLQVGAPSYLSRAGELGTFKTVVAATVDGVPAQNDVELIMGKGLLLWLIGIPIPLILLIWLFGGLH